MESAEEMVKMLKLDMTQRVSSMMVNLSKADAEVAMGKKHVKKSGNYLSSHNVSSEGDMSSNLRDFLTQKKEIDSLQSMLISNSESINRFKQEKKELLRTNFVRDNNQEPQF